jgi:hypothetical protein
MTEISTSRGGSYNFLDENVKTDFVAGFFVKHTDTFFASHN